MPIVILHNISISRSLCLNAILSCFDKMESNVTKMAVAAARHDHEPRSPGARLLSPNGTCGPRPRLGLLPRAHLSESPR